MPVQNLYDSNGSYPVYNPYSGSLRDTGSNQTYVPPHVITFIGNYKHDRLNITPTVQFQGGVQYGRPLQISGVNPVGGAALGTATTTAGDPRSPRTPARTAYATPPSPG